MKKGLRQKKILKPFSNTYKKTRGLKFQWNESTLALALVIPGHFPVLIQMWEEIAPRKGLFARTAQGGARLVKIAVCLVFKGYDLFKVIFQQPHKPH